MTRRAAAVRHSRPVASSGDEERRPTGTVTFLFTDVEGSTRWWATDKEAMSASLQVHDAVLRAAIESNGGYVFTTAGDSFAAAFTRPTDAVCAATDAQRALADATWPGPALLVRMGLHLGEAEERAGDYFGPVVNTAARVEAAGHGGQVLTTEAVRLAASIADAVDLGTHRLRDVAEPIRLFQLGDGTFPPLRVIDPGRSNLPARPTRLIGREDEVTRVRRLLTEHRLVTITAVGGVGKTRLAIAIGESELAHRPGGVWFVDLTTVVDGSDVPAAIANAVGVTLRPGNATDQIVRYLADKAALVILDNCEHVIDDCAEFAERFLAAHGPAIILATSREALDVDGERAVVLGSLPTDTPDSAGVRLFVDRAAAVDPAFAVTTDDPAIISAICGRLDGMPLAIELAAARVTVMTTAELLAGLDDRFQLLAGGRRRQRQRTLEAMLDWSYDLLAPVEQEVFRALGVFVDGFDLDAVAALTRSDRTSAMAVIEALVAKSLVVRADGGDVARFTLLETVKAYAEDRLVDAGEAADVRNRHLEHFRSLAMAEGRVPFAYVSVGIRLRHDTSNIAVAFGWASGTEQWTAAGELLAGSAMAFWAAVQMIEYRALADRAIADLATRDRELAGYVQCQVLYALGMVQDWPSFVPMIRDLATSPVPALRVIGTGDDCVAGGIHRCRSRGALPRSRAIGVRRARNGAGARPAGGVRGDQVGGREPRVVRGRLSRGARELASSPRRRRSLRMDLRVARALGNPGDVPGLDRRTHPGARGRLPARRIRPRLPGRIRDPRARAPRARRDGSGPRFGQGTRSARRDRTRHRRVRRQSLAPRRARPRRRRRSDRA